MEPDESRPQQLAYPLVEAMSLLGHGDRCAGYALMRARKLKTFKVGRRRMVSRKALHDCIELLEREEQERVAEPPGEPSTPREPAAA
jgi:hypothetical protein